jgi:hypothetical protein
MDPSMKEMAVSDLFAAILVVAVVARKLSFVQHPPDGGDRPKKLSSVKVFQHYGLELRKTV